MRPRAHTWHPAAHKTPSLHSRASPGPSCMHITLPWPAWFSVSQAQATIRIWFNRCCLLSPVVSEGLNASYLSPRTKISWKNQHAHSGYTLRAAVLIYGSSHAGGVICSALQGSCTLQYQRKSFWIYLLAMIPAHCSKKMQPNGLLLLDVHGDKGRGDDGLNLLLQSSNKLLTGVES